MFNTRLEDYMCKVNLYIHLERLSDLSFPTRHQTLSLLWLPGNPCASIANIFFESFPCSFDKCTRHLLGQYHRVYLSEGTPC